MRLDADPDKHLLDPNALNYSTTASRVAQGDTTFFDIRSLELPELEKLMRDIASLPWLADEELESAMKFLATTPEPARSYISALGHAVKASNSPRPVPMYNKAISKFQRALNHPSRGMDAIMTAKTHNCLGSCYSALGELSDSGRPIHFILSGLGHFKNAAKMITPQADPKLWVKISGNLGACLCSLGERVAGLEGRQHLFEAVAVCLQVLEICQQNNYHEERLDIRENLGCALLSLGTRSTGEE
ncbi:MAG: hypothetical protein OEY50_08995, partial [Nitrospinota bacterium]|nr:hypothetical protein [Nitrospinota bacterium]